jgi:hypothetical protein
MNKEQLENKLTLIEESFNKIQEQRTNLDKQLTDLTAESLKLEGEYRAVKNLIDNLQVKKK